MRRLWLKVKELYSFVISKPEDRLIEYPTDVRLECDGTTEIITLTGNLFWCAWGMKGIRQGNPAFKEVWLSTDDPNNASVVLSRPSSSPPQSVFIPRGSIGLATLYPDKPMPPSAGALDRASSITS